jgi:hypothetical protein
VSYSRLFPALLLLLICTAASLASDRYYVGPDNGLWSDPNNWSLTDGGPGGAGPPPGVANYQSTDSSYNAILSSDTSKGISLDTDYSSSSGLHDVVLNGTSLNQGSHAMLAFSESVFASAGRTTVWTQGDGNNQLWNTGNLYIRADAGGSATYILSGSGTLSRFDCFIDAAGDGQATFTQLAGLHTGGNSVSVGHLLGTTGKYELKGGTLGVDALFIGEQGSGTFDQSGGFARDAFSGLYVALGSGATGTYNLSAGTAAFTGARIGYGGTGLFNQSGGSVSIQSNSMYVASGSSSHGTYNLSGGSLSVSLSTSSLYLGYGGTGVFNQTGGGVQAILHVGGLAGSHATYNLSGGELNGFVTNNDTFNQTGGVINTSVFTNNASLAIYPGTETLTRQFTQAAAGKLILELDDPDTNDYPRIEVTSFSAPLNGNLTVTLQNDYTPSLGDTFTLITSPSLSGTFSSYTLPPLPNGLTWLPTYTPTSFSLSVAIPEPTLSLLLLLPLLAPRRRRGSRLREVQVLP